MRFKKYLIERRVPPVPSEVFEKALQKQIAVVVATKQRFQKSLDSGEYSKTNITFKKWQEFDTLNYQTNREGENYEYEVNLDIKTFILDMLPNNFLEDVAKKYGYFISMEGNRGSYEKYYQFQQAYGMPVDQDKVPDKMYHVSGYWNKHKILKKGIIPMKGTRSWYKYPPSVFLMTKFDLNYMQTLAKSIEQYGEPQSETDIRPTRNKPAEWTPIVIFEINTKKLRKGTRFYYDTDARWSVRTFTHIPPSAIKVKWEDPDAVRAYGD